MPACEHFSSPKILLLTWKQKLHSDVTKTQELVSMSNPQRVGVLASAGPLLQLCQCEENYPQLCIRTCLQFLAPMPDLNCHTHSLGRSLQGSVPSNVSRGAPVSPPRGRDYISVALFTLALPSRQTFLWLYKKIIQY